MEIVQAAFRSSQLASDPITNDAVSSAVADAVTDAADRYHLTDATARPILGLLDGVVARMRREVSKIDEQFERFIAGCGG